jgi:hypothetical protein
MSFIGLPLRRGTLPTRSSCLQLESDSSTERMSAMFRIGHYDALHRALVHDGFGVIEAGQGTAR